MTSTELLTVFHIAKKISLMTSQKLLQHCVANTHSNNLSSLFNMQNTFARPATYSNQLFQSDHVVEKFRVLSILKSMPFDREYFNPAYLSKNTVICLKCFTLHLFLTDKFYFYFNFCSLLWYFIIQFILWLLFNCDFIFIFGEVYLNETILAYLQLQMKRK